MYLEKNSEKKWIVKSENTILGPYSFDQIIDLIRKKQISLIDEIRDTETRWLYVRENAEFKSIVEEMRKEIDARQESTKTYQSQSKIEDPLQKTKTDINQFTDINLETKDIDVVKEILSNSFEMTPPPPKAVEKARVYGVQTDAVVQEKLGLFSNKLMVSSIVAVVLAVSAFFGYVYIQKRNIQRQEEELALQIKKYRFLGLYQKAIEVFSKLPQSNQKKLLPDLLEIYPLLESAGLVNYDMIKSMKVEFSLNLEQKANIELINYWQSMKQQNYGEAQEYLVKATALQPASLLIKENEALLQLKKGQSSAAFKQFKNIFNEEKNGRYLLGMVQSFWGLSSSEKNVYNHDLLQSLERYTTVYYDYKKELLLAQITLAQELGNDVLYKVSVKQFLNTPCLLSQKFTKPTLLAPNSYLWKDLSEIKNIVLKSLSGDEVMLFQLHDLLEADQLSAATEYLASNVSKMVDPKNKEEMNLLLFNSQSRSKEVVALEKSNRLDLSLELNHLLLAQNKLDLDPNADIKSHLDYLTDRQQIFYEDWLRLEQLIKKNQIPELRLFVKDHFITTQNFLPVFEAKGLVNQ
jgi:hypothetical protein